MWPLLLVALTASTPSLPKIAVMDITLRGGVPTTVAQVLSDDLVAEVRKRRQRSQIISAEEIRSMLSMVSQQQKLGCDNVSCLAEIGGALGAEQMVNGTLGKLGNTYVFGLKVVDVHHAQVLRSAAVNLSTRDDEQLLAAVKSLVAQLFPDVQLAPQPTVQPEPVPEAALQAPIVGEPEHHHSHVPSIAIGVAGLALGAVAVVGLTQILNYDNEANAVNSGNENPPLRRSTVTSDQSAAKIWQPVSIGLGVLAVAGVTTAVILW